MNIQTRFLTRKWNSLHVFISLTILLWSLEGGALQAKSKGVFPNPIAISTDAKQSLLLHKTGESGRKAFIFPLYRIAHYTDAFLDKSKILDYPGPKAVRMIFQRKIGGQRIQEEVKKAIKERVSPKDWVNLSVSANEFCEPYGQGAVNKGDIFSVVWYTDGWLVSQFNGKEIGRLKDPGFARALWSIWVGEQSLVNTEDLLNGWNTHHK